MVPRRPGKSASPIIFVAILALASIASATVAFSPYLFTYHNPGAIKIGASLSPSDAAENQTITVTVSDRNTLPNTVDELTLPAGGALGDNLSMGPRCGYLPFGIAVFLG